MSKVYTVHENEVKHVVDDKIVRPSLIIFLEKYIQVKGVYSKPLEELKRLIISMEVTVDDKIAGFQYSTCNELLKSSLAIIDGGSFTYDKDELKVYFMAIKNIVDAYLKHLDIVNYKEQLVVLYKELVETGSADVLKKILPLENLELNKLDVMFGDYIYYRNSLINAVAVSKEFLDSIDTIWVQVWLYDFLKELYILTIKLLNMYNVNTVDLQQHKMVIYRIYQCLNKFDITNTFFVHYNHLTEAEEKINVLAKQDLTPLDTAKIRLLDGKVIEQELLIDIGDIIESNPILTTNFTDFSKQTEHLTKVLSNPFDLSSLFLDELSFITDKLKELEGKLQNALNNLASKITELNNKLQDFIDSGIAKIEGALQNMIEGALQKFCDIWCAIKLLMCYLNALGNLFSQFGTPFNWKDFVNTNLDALFSKDTYTLDKLKSFVNFNDRIDASSASGIRLFSGSITGIFDSISNKNFNDKIKNYPDAVKAQLKSDYNEFVSVWNNGDDSTIFQKVKALTETNAYKKVMNTFLTSSEQSSCKFLSPPLLKFNLFLGLDIDLDFSFDLKIGGCSCV